MRIQEVIETDLKAAIRDKNDIIKENLKIIVSELQRQRSKILSDVETTIVLRQLKTWETTRLDKCNITGGSTYLDIIDNYMPSQATDEEIKEWINENIDLTKFGNKYAAIKPTLKHFGLIATDKPTIKRVIDSM